MKISADVQNFVHFFFFFGIELLTLVRYEVVIGIHEI